MAAITRSEIQAIIDRLDRIEQNTATKDDLKALEQNMASKDDLKALEQNLTNMMQAKWQGLHNHLHDYLLPPEADRDHPHDY